MKIQVLLTTVGLACAGFGAGYPSDLVLYSTFDDEAAITSPKVGPAGSVSGGTFVDGKFGGALVSPANPNLAKFVIDQGLPVEKGCIDFYAKIVKDGTTYNKDGGDPSLIGIENPTLHGVVGWLCFNTNDGLGNHGLICSMPTGYTGAMSGHGASYEYSTVFGEKNPKDWHHYAIVWNTNGIAGGSQTLRVYLDGAVFASDSRTGFDSSYVTKMSSPVELRFLHDEGSTYASFLIDELRVWSTDRTTFPEGPINPDVVLPVVSEVTAKQHYPWCGKVDIGYTVAGSTDGLLVKISVKDNDNNKTYEAKTFDVMPTASVGAHSVVWNATADGVDTPSKSLVATVSLVVPAN